MADSNSSKKATSKPKPLGLKNIKSSVFSRTMSMTKLTIQAGAKLALHNISSVGNSQVIKNEKWQEFLKKQAGHISSELGQLKGSLMKAGQMLSVYGEHFLPPEANNLLKSLQQDSPPLSWPSIEALLIKHLGVELMSELEIETTALASASMGQVHRARIKSTNESICLKIQYPNIDKAINSDLKAIKTLFYTLKILPNDLDLTSIFDEINSMLIQECDYSIEAQLTTEYGQLLKGDNRFVVPKVFPRYSNNKILATSFEKGLRVDDPLIQKLAIERRNKIALNYLDLYFKEIFSWCLVQTDPHIGNYKIRINPDGHDQIVLLDFGATRRFDIGFIGPYRKMIKGSLINNKELFNSAATEIGFIQDADHPQLKELFEEFCFETVEPFIEFNDPRNNNNQIAEDGTYDWKNTDLPNRLSQKVMEILKSFSWRTPPREIIFLDRKTGGVFIFLSVLKAKIKGRDVILPYLEKLPQ